MKLRLYDAKKQLSGLMADRARKTSSVFKLLHHINGLPHHPWPSVHELFIPLFAVQDVRVRDVGRAPDGGVALRAGGQRRRHHRPLPALHEGILLHPPHW